jgi:hypothetical protein
MLKEYLKKPAKLAEAERIPSSIQNVPTDVYPTGIIYAQQGHTERHRPAPGGVSIGQGAVTPLLLYRCAAVAFCPCASLQRISGCDLKSDIEISRKDAKPQRSGERLRVIACMHFTTFTCSVNSFSVNFQDRLGGIAALRDAKSGFRM